MRDVGAVFRGLHRPGAPFVLVNVWDAGMAKVAAAVGARALASSSAGHAFTLGRRDMGGVSREEALVHAEGLVRATGLPVSGDFENGFGEAPETVAETVRLAAEAGLAGCSIEDTALPSMGAYGFDLAVERVRAAVAAARGVGRDFVLTARADGVMNGGYSFDEALERVRAFERVGADCLYVPATPSFDDLRRLCAAVGRPVNALVAGEYSRCRLGQFADVGVARVSLGSTLARVVQQVAVDAMRTVLDDGDFSCLMGAADGKVVDAMLARSTGKSVQ